MTKKISSSSSTSPAPSSSSSSSSCYSLLLFKILIATNIFLVLFLAILIKSGPEIDLSFSFSQINNTDILKKAAVLEKYLYGIDEGYVTDPSKEAFVTLLTSESYVAPVLALIQSLRETKTTRKILIMYTKEAGVSEQILEAMRGKLGAEPILVDSILCDRCANRYYDTWSKFQIFKLTTFNKVVFLDGDCLVLNNLDHLFSLPSPSAAPDLLLSMAGSLKFNAGVMVLSPSLETFQNIMEFIQRKLEENPGEKLDKVRFGEISSPHPNLL